MTEHIQLTDDSRLAIEVDEGPTCPRGDWHMLTGFVKLANRGDSRLDDVPAVHEPPIDIADAYERFFLRGDWVPYTDVLYRRRAEAEAFVTRWALAFHGLVVEYDHEHGGFWFVAGADAATAQTEVDDYSRALFYDNWPELELGSAEHLKLQREVIAQEQETYRQWAEGEVYGVVLQRRKRYVAVVDNDPEYVTTHVDWADEIEHWEDGDSIWGCYLTDDYTAKSVALEHFELTEAETSALTIQ